MVYAIFKLTFQQLGCPTAIVRFFVIDSFEARGRVSVCGCVKLGLLLAFKEIINHD